MSCLVLVRNADMQNNAVQIAIQNKSLLSLQGLTDESSLEYMANVMGISPQVVPPALRKFVTQVTMGNPMYIRETLFQLQEDQLLTLKNGNCIIVPGSLDNVNIASWSHTAMVGGTVCVLESLDPIEAAALKMSTCFEGAFTLPDLAASSCSQWGGATHFELLRLFRATRKLIKMSCIVQVPAPINDGIYDIKYLNQNTQYFQMKSALVRTVGAAMVLEAQKKSVKRNALVDRVLKNDLPERMLRVLALKSVQHIPWYYERVLRRMV